MEEFVLKILSWAVAKYPMAVSLLAILGITRAVIKPIMSFLGELVIIIPGDKDDKLLAKIVESKSFKAAVFFLDYLTSIKVTSVKEEKPSEKIG